MVIPIPAPCSRPTDIEAVLRLSPPLAGLVTRKTLPPLSPCNPMCDRPCVFVHVVLLDSHRVLTLPIRNAPSIQSATLNQPTHSMPYPLERHNPAKCHCPNDPAKHHCPHDYYPQHTALLTTVSRLSFGTPADTTARRLLFSWSFWLSFSPSCLLG